MAEGGSFGGVISAVDWTRLENEDDDGHDDEERGHPVDVVVDTGETSVERQREMPFLSLNRLL